VLCLTPLGVPVFLPLSVSLRLCALSTDLHSLYIRYWGLVNVLWAFASTVIGLMMDRPTLTVSAVD